MGILFKVSGFLMKLNYYTKFFVVVSDIAEYGSKRFKEAYPPEEAPKPEEEQQIIEDAK